MSRNTAKIAARDRKRKQRLRDRTFGFGKVEFLSGPSETKALQTLARISSRPIATCAKQIVKDYIGGAISDWLAFRKECFKTLMEMQQYENVAMALKERSANVTVAGVSYSGERFRILSAQRMRQAAWLSSQGLGPRAQKVFWRSLVTDPTLIS